MALAEKRKAAGAARALQPANDSSGLDEAGRHALLRFITCGSVDDGKSTLIGRMLYEAGAVFDDQLSALDDDSRKFGTQGTEPDFALLVDGLSAEREQGITIDVAYRYFATGKRSFIVADTPGHEQYTRNMATGASTADLAIILIDARKGLLPQTRRHSFIVSLVGVRHIVVAINKMDLVGHDEAVFERIAAEYRAATAGLGFASLHVVPVSAKTGENVTTHATTMPWYRGPALLPLLEDVAIGGERLEEDGFILPVQWVNRPDLDFRGYAGSAARGRARIGDEITVLPSGKRSRIAGLIGMSGEVGTVGAGQAVTVTLSDDVDISRGDLIVAAHAAPGLHRELTARLLWTSERPLQEGAQYLIKLATQTANATLGALHHSIDLEGFRPVPAASLGMNGIGSVTLRLDRPLAALPYDRSRELGGFILIDRISNETVAFGFVAADGDAGRETRADGLRVDASWRQRMVVRLFGTAGTPSRRHRLEALSWRLASGAGIFAVTFALTGEAGLASTLAFADLVLRPPLRQAHASLWRDRSGPALQDGAGI